MEHKLGGKRDVLVVLRMGFLGLGTHGQLEWCNGEEGDTFGL